MKLTSFAMSYLTITHILAAVGKPRPQFQRGRLPNTLLTLCDAATYAAMYRMMKSTKASGVLLAIPVVGAAAHLSYVITQLDDGWYREYADDYEQPTLVNGKLLHKKMAVASADAALYTIGLAHLLTSVPLAKTAIPVVAGAVAGLVAWKPWAREEEPAKP